HFRSEIFDSQEELSGFMKRLMRNQPDDFAAADRDSIALRLAPDCFEDEFHRRLFEVGQVHRDLRLITISEQNPHCLTYRNPPLENRMRFAMYFAMPRLAVFKLMLYAMSGFRAPTTVAPAVG